MSRKISRVAFGALAVALTACQDATAPTTIPQTAKAVVQPNYIVEMLPTLPGGAGSYAYAINDVGQIVGYSLTSAGTQHAVLWTSPLLPATDLGTLGGDFSTAEGISNSSFVAGMSTLATGEGHAFRWAAAGGMIDLGTLGGTDSYGYDAGELGEVVGVSYLADGYTQHAFLWTPAAGMRDLGSLPGYGTSIAFGINSFGDVVGAAIDASGFRAVMWPAAGGIVDLGVTLTAWGAQALAISDNGTVAGQMDMLDGTTHAFTWKAGILTDVGVVLNSPLVFSGASGANNKGSTVGVAWDPVNFTQPCPSYCPAVLNPKTGFQLLPRLTTTSDGIAESMNTPGVIVGVDQQAGTNQAVRWRERKI